MCSSVLGLDQYGRTIVVATTSDATTAPGQVFVVVDPTQIGLMPELGRRPTLEEMKGVRNPPMLPPPPTGNHRPRQYA